MTRKSSSATRAIGPTQKASQKNSNRTQIEKRKNDQPFVATTSNGRNPFEGIQAEIKSNQNCDQYGYSSHFSFPLLFRKLLQKEYPRKYRQPCLIARSSTQWSMMIPAKVLLTASTFIIAVRNLAQQSVSCCRSRCCVLSSRNVF